MGQDWEQRKALDRTNMTAEADAGKQKVEEPKNGGKKDNGGGGYSDMRLMLSRDLIALGFVMVLGVFALAVAFLTPAEVAGAIGPITTLVGTLVGLAFGAQVGQQGKQAETEARKNAEILAAEAVAALPSDAAQPLVARWRNSTLQGNPRPEDF